MKKLMITVLVSTFVFGLVGMAHAALFTETFLGTPIDATSVTLNGQKNTASDYATFAFNLAGSGGVATKNGASISGALTEDSTNFIPISNPNIIQSAVLKIYYSTTQTAPFSIQLFDIINGAVQSTLLFPAINNYTSGSDIDLTNYKSALLDGSIFVKFQNTNSSGNSSKNISLDQAQLIVTTPLPGAAWLLGAGLIGLVGARRKQLV